MGKNKFFFFLIIAIQTVLKAQNVKQQLLLAAALEFHKTVYVFGYEQSHSKLFFKCISYNDKLQVKDSVLFNLGKHTPADYLEINADTLHGVLNFYFQLADQKNQVILLRLNDSLQKIGSAENYDANHVNAMSVFDDEKYVWKEDLYVIRTSSDSSGKQFYLSKYHVRDMRQPFDYEYKWQFAFERKYIYRASVMYADSMYVMVYAHVYDGIKKGQWLLRINAKTGTVMKGTKLSKKGDSRHFLMSDVLIDNKNKGISVIGSIYDDNMIDFRNKSSNFTNQSKNHKLFLISIDSIGEISSRIEKPFPLPLQTKAGHTLQSFHLKIREFVKKNDGSFEVWSDVYEQTLPNLFTYYSSWQFNLIPNDVDYEIVRSTFTIGSKAVPNFTSLAKGDFYGKFVLNDIGEYDKFKYKKPMNDVVIKTGKDHINNAFYILKKTEIVSSKKTYYHIFMGKKALEHKVLLKSEQGQNINLFFTGVTSYISFLTNIGNTNYELKIQTL